MDDRAYGEALDAMVREGAGLVVGTVAASGEPRATRAWSVRPVDGVAGRLRVAVTADDEIALGNVRDGIVALTAADVRTLRSVQVKGRVVSVSPPTDADLAATDDQTERFFRGVHETDGNPLEALRRMLPRSIAVIEVDVSDAYDQTPGPVAGCELGPVTA